MGILAWILFGLIVGVIAKAIRPATGGWIKTIIIGIVGSMIGGWVGTLLGFGDVTGFNVRSIALAVLGAVILIWLIDRFKGK